MDGTLHIQCPLRAFGCSLISLRKFIWIQDCNYFFKSLFLNYSLAQLHLQNMDSIFVSARASLLELQDEREIVIRNCRDITAYSKKIIFSGQRIKAVPIRSGNYKEIKTNFSIIALRLAQVNESYIASAQKGSLRGTIASACEELIEASFDFHLLCGQ